MGWKTSRGQSISLLVLTAWLIWISLLVLAAWLIWGRRDQNRGLDVLRLSSCRAPCWQNITPGTTRKQEVLQALEAVPWIDPTTISEHDLQDFGTTFTWEGSVDPYSSLQGSVEANAEDIVSKVYITFHPQQWPMVSIDDLIEVYGPPVIQVRASRANLFRTSFMVYLYYPQSGLFIAGHFYDLRHSDPLIPPRVSVISIDYVAPDRFYESTNMLPACEFAWDGYKESSAYCYCAGQAEDWAKWQCPPWQ